MPTCFTDADTPLALQRRTLRGVSHSVVLQEARVLDE
jgi:hypothetical protein